MPDVYRRRLAQSPGGLLAALAQGFVDFCNNFVGTSKSADSFLIFTGPPTGAQIDYSYTDSTGTSQNYHDVVYAGWVNQGENLTDFPPDFAAKDPGFSPHMVVDMQAPGLTDYTPADVIEWATQLVTLQEEFFGDLCLNGTGLAWGGPIGGTWDDSVYNRTIWQRTNWFFRNGQLFGYTTKIMAMNVDPGGLILTGVVESIPDAPDCQIGQVAESPVFIQAIQDLGMKDVDVQFNRGANIFSVRSAVTTG